MSRLPVVFLVCNNGTLLTRCECLVYAAAHLYLERHFILVFLFIPLYVCVAQTLGKSVVSFPLWVLGLNSGPHTCMANALPC